ncbi:MAG: hypothetical protein QOJ37_989 [Pseudonocardiales bacterium]|nr:hypothetical protein [Pseudonocardiales bacterium]
MCGAADMPMTPPVSATARSTASPFSRGMSHSARAPACVINTGASLRSQTSSPVRSEECEMSIARPTAFIRATAWRPNRVNPPSRASDKPVPSALESL